MFFVKIWNHFSPVQQHAITVAATTFVIAVAGAFGVDISGVFH